MASQFIGANRKKIQRKDIIAIIMKNENRKMTKENNIDNPALTAGVFSLCLNLELP
jgi:hypothetical protein